MTYTMLFEFALIVLLTARLTEPLLKTMLLFSTFRLPDTLNEVLMLAEVVILVV